MAASALDYINFCQNIINTTNEQFPNAHMNNANLTHSKHGKGDNSHLRSDYVKMWKESATALLAHAGMAEDHIVRLLDHLGNKSANRSVPVEFTDVQKQAIKLIVTWQGKIPNN